MLWESSGTLWESSGTLWESSGTLWESSETLWCVGVGSEVTRFTSLAAARRGIIPYRWARFTGPRQLPRSLPEAKVTLGDSGGQLGELRDALGSSVGTTRVGGRHHKGRR